MTTGQENLDAEEVQKFNELSNQWWEPTGSLKTLHIINPARSQYIADRITIDDRSILDVGCGGGILTEALAKQGARMTGIDASTAAIKAAQEHAQDQPFKIDYHAQTAEQFAQNGGPCFDVITCMELLEHVPNPKALIQTMAQLLNSQGHLILATINRNLASYLGAIIAAEYVFGLLPRGTHDYASFIRPSELCRWLRAADFSLEHMAGLHYIPGANYCTITSSPTINYLVHARLQK